MYISRLKIFNFKKFRNFSIDFNADMNIIVGNNEVGKSTILEAIHLALTGIYRNRYLKGDLSHYLFNQELLKEYFSLLRKGEEVAPPSISIELWFDEADEFVGNTNSEGVVKGAGITYSIILNEDFRQEFDEYVRSSQCHTLPVEYYTVNWQSFRRDQMTSKKIPIRSHLIDGGLVQNNLSGQFISHILRNLLSDEDCVNLSHVVRLYQEFIEAHEQVNNINQKIQTGAELSDDEQFSLSSDYSSSRLWENILIANIDKIPIHYKGKGSQVGIQTKLSLAKSSSTNNKQAVVLIEEPESHLSFASMNKLISFIDNHRQGRQIFITTHSSFVMNKLGLESLILLSNDNNNIRLDELSEDTSRYFRKLAGYETLRMLLAHRSILVEGDSDELVVQKAFKQEYGKMPIEDGVDVQCIKGLSFLRFLELARLLKLNVRVVTDNDGNIDKIKDKYKEYLGPNAQPTIVIDFGEEIFSSEDFSGDCDLGNFNYNTLEPNILKTNTLSKLNGIFGTTYTSEKEILRYMHNHKSDCALKILLSEEIINIPEYISRAVKNE